jgi:hypothetical protein
MNTPYIVSRKELKGTFRTLAMLFYILQKKNLIESYVFFKDLLPYIILPLHFRASDILLFLWAIKKSET